MSLDVSNGYSLEYPCRLTPRSSRLILQQFCFCLAVSVAAAKFDVLVETPNGGILL